MGNMVCVNSYADIFSSVSGGVLSIFSIIFLFVGIKKLSKLIELYTEKHFEAVYGFYSNLESCCDDFLIAVNTNIEYWKKADKKSEGWRNETDKAYEKILSENAKYLIHLFKSEKNQVPPKCCKEWEKRIKAFREKLGRLCYIGKLDYIVEYVKFIEDFKKDLEFITDAIEKEKTTMIPKLTSEK